MVFGEGEEVGVVGGGVWRGGASFVKFPTSFSA